MRVLREPVIFLLGCGFVLFLSFLSDSVTGKDAQGALRHGGDSPVGSPAPSNATVWTSGSHCTLAVLQPSAGAADFWPLESLPFPYERASPTPGVRQPVWRLELCIGGSATALLPAAGSAGGEEAVRRLLPPASTRSHCTPAEACVGAVVVTRLVGCPLAGADGGGACVSARLNGGALRPQECGVPPLADAPSAEAIEDAWELGPDELLARLEGAEFLALRCLHVGACRYVCPFAVTIPGSYRLIVEGLRAGWAAIAEAGGFPPLIRDKIAGDKLLIELGGGRAADTAANEVARAGVVAAARCGSDGSGGGGDRPHGVLPPCDDANAPGRWVRTVSVDGMFAPNESWWLPLQREYPTAGPFSESKGLGSRFFTQLDAELEWLPYTCCLRPLVPAAAAACISDSFSARGDSHSRVFFNHLMRFACGFEETAAKQHWGTLCASAENIAASETCAALRGACYAWDPRAEEAISWAAYNMTPTPPLGHMLINFGQHWPSERHATLSNYETHIRNYFAGLEAVTPPPSYFIWMETPPLPVITNLYIYTVADWRTEPRLRLFNAAADRALASLVSAGKIRILRVFEKFLPLADCSPDSAHFNISAAMYAVTQSFVATACG